MIPDFNRSGKLPAGIHTTTLDEFENRFGFNNRRQKFIKGLKLAISHLKEINCKVIYVDGSFVTNKLLPNDYDALWEVTGLDWAEAQRKHSIFTDLSAGTKKQKVMYFGEFYPAEVIEGRSGEPFLTFFQRDRDGTKKGIIRINI